MVFLVEIVVFVVVVVGLGVVVVMGLEVVVVVVDTVEQPGSVNVGTG